MDLERLLAWVDPTIVHGQSGPPFDASEARATMLAAGRSARQFHSPTLSDWAHLGHVAGIKWGPGLSEVSHTADEWVEMQAVEDAAVLYQRVVDLVLA